MKKLLILLLLIPFISNAQCGYVLKNGVRYKIPCDYDYTSFHEDTLRFQESLFIEYINIERKKRNLLPLVYDETLYTDVATPQAIRMAQESQVSHTKENVYECCTSISYLYRSTDLSSKAIKLFKNSKSHWNFLMLPSITKIAVRIEIDENNSEKHTGKVYMSVVMDS